MSRSVAWRGRLADPDRIDSLEDALLEIALEFGGQFHSFHAERSARGGILDLAPGLGRVVFAVGRDGSLGSAPGEPPASDGWVSAETQFASAKAHALLVEVLEALRDEFFAGLQIRDEADAVEKQERSTARRRVRTLLSLPEGKRPTIGEEDPEDADSRTAGTEAEWDAFCRRNERRNAGVRRALDHATSAGGAGTDAFLEALRDEGVIGMPGEESPGMEIDDDPEDEPWKEPVEETGHGEPPPSREELFPPLLRRAQELSVFAMKATDDSKSALDPEYVLCSGLLELSGGLAQALSSEEEDDAGLPYGLIVFQLKRALRGVEFSRGAIPACREAARMSRESLDTINGELAMFEGEIRERLDEARRAWKTEKR